MIKKQEIKYGNKILKIGEEIEYHDSAGENGEDLYNGRWLVLGKDDDDNLLIVSENNVTTYCFNEYRDLKGAMNAYSYGVKKLNDICSKYAKGLGAINARSLCIEDVDYLTGYDKKLNSNYEKEFEAHNSLDKIFIWHDGEKWRVINDYKIVTLTQTFYTYKASDTKLEKGSKEYDLLFGDDDKCYWLASRYISLQPKFIFFGLRKVGMGKVYGKDFVSTQGHNYNEEAGVRVVVTLEK